MPKLLDIPHLITGKLNYVTEQVVEIKRYSKDPTEYVYLSTGERIEFFFTSDLNEGDYYKIGYLPNTHKGVYCEKIDLGGNTEDVERVIGFPFKDILGFLAIIAVFFFLILISPYIKMKLFIPTSIIAIPTFAYLFIKNGVQNGIWFSAENDGLLGLIIVLISSLIVFFLYLIERRHSDGFDKTYIGAQFFSVFELGILIVMAFNLD